MGGRGGGGYKRSGLVMEKRKERGKKRFVFNLFVDPLDLASSVLFPWREDLNQTATVEKKKKEIYSTQEKNSTVDHNRKKRTRLE